MSFKIRVWRGKKYNAIESGMSEFGEIIMQHFEHSDNHRQLQAILLASKYYGLEPDWAFTDVSERGREYVY